MTAAPPPPTPPAIESQGIGYGPIQVYKRPEPAFNICPPDNREPCERVTMVVIVADPKATKIPPCRRAAPGAFACYITPKP